MCQGQRGEDPGAAGAGWAEQSQNQPTPHLSHVPGPAPLPPPTSHNTPRWRPFSFVEKNQRENAKLPRKDEIRLGEVTVGEMRPVSGSFLSVSVSFRPITLCSRGFHSVSPGLPPPLPAPPTSVPAPPQGLPKLLWWMVIHLGAQSSPDLAGSLAGEEGWLEQVSPLWRDTQVAGRNLARGGFLVAWSHLRQGRVPTTGPGSHRAEVQRPLCPGSSPVSGRSPLFLLAELRPLQHLRVPRLQLPASYQACDLGRSIMLPL